MLVHGAWADGSSWSRVITGLQRAGINVVAAPIPLTTLDDDVNAVKRAIDRTEGPVVLAGHAYAGGVPLLLVRGQMSDLVSQERADEFLARFPQVEFVDVQGAGHMVAGDRNDLFADAVLDFLVRQGESA